jgi:hypothetical protein
MVWEENFTFNNKIIIIFFTYNNKRENDEADPDDGEVLGRVVEEVKVQEEGHDDAGTPVHQCNLNKID